MKRIISIILVLALTVGSVLSLSSCTAKKGYFYSENIGLSEGVVNYLCSYYKYYYMSSLSSDGYEVSDTVKFWNTPYYGLSSTLGDYLKYYGEKYIINLLAANELFCEYDKLTYDDKVEIELAVNEIIEYYHGGSKKEFRAATEKYGFSYRDMYNAAELMYRAYVLEKRVVADMDKGDYYDEFFGEYRRVGFVFVSTEGMSEEQRAELDGYKSRFEEAKAISSEDGGEENALASVMEEIKAKYKDYSEHYIHASSEFAADFAKDNYEVAVAALQLFENDGKVFESSSSKSDEEDSDSFAGVVFMYCLPNEKGAYENSESKYFTDFEALATASYANVLVSEYAKDVKVGKKWESFDPVSIPYNSDYAPVFY